MMTFVAGFVLWINAKDPEVYLDIKKYQTYEECKQGGQQLFSELKKIVTKQDQLLGECFAFSPNVDEEQIKKYFKDNLKPTNHDPEI